MIDIDMVYVVGIEPFNIEIFEQIIEEQRPEFPLPYIGLMFRKCPQIDHNG
jgi:carbamoylphosphate synthase large subunit